MTVRELIEALEKEPNKDKPVRVYVLNEHNYDLDATLNIAEVDYSISDRVDINVISDYGRFV